MKVRYILNVSYKSPEKVDRTFELKLLSIAKRHHGVEGGSGFGFVDQRRDFDIIFHSQKNARKTRRRVVAYRKFKVKATLWRADGSNMVSIP